MSAHDFTTCDCTECHRALLDLQDELDELERTDPDVRAAAESYDRMVQRITSRPRSGLPTENARLYAREFAAEQLRGAAKWCEANGYDEAAVDHLIAKAKELWP